MLAFLMTPLGSAQAAPVCEGEPAPQPEAAGSGADGLLVPPQAAEAAAASPDGLPPDSSLYGQYGTAGQQWHVIRESCVDKMGSAAVATLSNTAWNLSKTINQSTITVYQAATSDGLLASFNTLVEDVVMQLREGIWRPLLPTVIILGAVWLGWYGLIRKRVTLTIESAVWMVLATALGIWILVNPGQILGYAGTIVNSGGQLVNSAISRVSTPSGGTVCPATAPEIKKAEWESQSDFAVRQNAQMLWAGLVCRPWIAGEFGSGVTADTAAEQYAMPLLKSQAISRVEQQQINNGEVDAVELVSEKQESYEEIASSIQRTYPEVYPLFEGEQQGSRLGVATLALFASVFAGGLILAASVALIVLKIGFLLLLLLSPIFLLIGIHPGYGRTVLLRWFEMLLGLLLKQIFVMLIVSLLVVCYGLVMATNLGWGLQMILLALFTLALFIYRRPFAHLFQSVNANTFTSRMVSDAVSSSALSRSANVLPPVAYMRAQKWGLKRSPQLAAAAAAVPAGGRGAAAATPDAGEAGRGGAAPDAAEAEGGPVRGDTGRARAGGGYGRVRGNAAPPPLKLGQTQDQDRGQQRAAAAAGRSTSEAPRLSEAASGGPGGSARAASAGRGSIPPRPSGGYTGTGDTGWASVFGHGGGESRSAPPRGAEQAPSGEGRRGADPNTGAGIFRGREATPPQGNINRRSRWGGPRTKQGRSAPPPRQQRPAPPSESGEGGSWLTGSRDRKNDAPISPFWTGAESQRRRDARRDVPFWLRDED
ncbi:type IV secretion system protein [Streptomonospora wellingtoniae]|uniref:Type IV secretion system protein n=1 Tax=Streptomonospora wellingtoniae TaxID=3075544 RepID=A0ABU2KZV8_9ACTN|nr:type IV secretion system protein [Streptomonospora sp. DSM 45055]MDT0304840.1 type IV secretion system protein [Streptomonospora sp. DSM 45055]